MRFPSGRLPQHRKAVFRNDIKYFVRNSIPLNSQNFDVLTFSKTARI